MLIDRILYWRAQNANAPAIYCNGVTHTYAHFADMIGYAQSCLDALDAPRGGLAIILLENFVDKWVTTLACQQRGTDTIIVDGVETAAALKVEASCFLVPYDRPDLIAKLKSLFVGTKVVALPRFASAKRQDLPVSKSEAVCGQHYLLTSGTTGSSKCVEQSRTTEDRRNESMAQEFWFDANTRFYVGVYDLYTAIGYWLPSSAWHVGGAVIFENNAPVSQLVQQGVISDFILVPVMIPGFIQMMEGVPKEKRNITVFVSGGFLSGDMATKLANLLTTPLYVHYASTEIHALTLRSIYQSIDDVIWFKEAGTRRIDIVDSSGALCPIGVEGALRIGLTDLDAQEYFGTEPLSRKVFDDGFFYPGDMAVRREDGRIRILGRVDDVLNFKGLKVAVAPYEQELQTLLNVSNVCVFSFLDADANEKTFIAIETHSYISENQKALIRERFKRLPEISFHTLPEFPRQSRGLRKIDRMALRKLVSGEASH